MLVEHEVNPDCASHSYDPSSVVGKFNSYIVPLDLSLPIALPFPLCYPASVDSPAAPDLALLEKDHRLPLLIVDCIDVAASFDAHTAPWSSLGQSIHLWHIDEFSSVVLERGLCAQRLEMDLAVRVVELAKCLQRL